MHILYLYIHYKVHKTFWVPETCLKHIFSFENDPIPSKQKKNITYKYSRASNYGDNCKSSSKELTSQSAVKSLSRSISRIVSSKKEYSSVLSWAPRSVLPSSISLFALSSWLKEDSGFLLCKDLLQTRFSSFSNSSFATRSSKVCKSENRGGNYS